MQRSLTACPRPASSGKPHRGKPRKGKGKFSREDVTESFLTALEIILADDISEYLSDEAKKFPGALIKTSKVFAFGDTRTALRWHRMSPRERAVWVVRQARMVAA